MTDEIIKLAESAEELALEIVGLRKNVVGALVDFESGYKVANSYWGNRSSTIISLERRSKSWFITSAKASQIHRDGGAKPKVTLTPAQDRAVIARLRSKYNVTATEA